MRRVTIALLLLAGFPALGLSQGTPVEVANIVAAPTVSNTSSTQNVPANAATVIITGNYFDSDPLPNTNTVMLSGAGLTGSVAATVTVSVTPTATSITVNMPSGVTSGFLSAVVTSYGGSSGAAIPIANIVAVPTITAASPTSGPVTGGTAVTLTGTNLTGATQATFGPGTVSIPPGGTPTTLAINCGGVAAGTFVADNVYPNGTYSTGGGQGTTPAGTTIPAAVAALFPSGTTAAQQQSVLNTARYGGTSCYYTIPGLGAGSTCTVTLFFAEGFYNGGNGGVGSRVFSVYVNNSATPQSMTAVGTTYTATQYDMYAAAENASGGTTGFNYATAVQFTATADGTGNLKLLFQTVTNSYVINGLMVATNTGTAVSATTPAITTGGGQYPVTVTTPGGIATGVNYSYLPVVSGDTPAYAAATPTADLTITGNGFTTATVVNIGGAGVFLPNFTVNSDTSITVPAANMPNMAAAGATTLAPTVTVSVTALGPSGSATSTANGTLTYLGAPTITAVSPGSGSVTGGNSVILTGTNLGNASSVSFGNASVPLTSGPTTLAVRFGSETALAQGSVTFLAQGTYGGNGDNTNGTAVTLTAALTTAYPNITAGLFNGYSQGGGITYTFTGWQPNSTATLTLFLAEEYGPFGTGNRVWSVAINGTTPTAFTNIDVAKLGGGSNRAIFLQATGTADSTGTLKLVCTASTNQPCLCGGIMIQGVMGGSLTVTTPAITTGGGAVPVSVTTMGGTGTYSGTFGYLPVVSSVSPNSGSMSPTAQVTITGNGFTGATKVTFGSSPAGDVPAASFVSASETSIVVVPPSTSTAGAVSVSVTAQSATSGATGPVTSVTNGGYTYIAPPGAISLSPTGGSVAGGNTVTINGSGTSSATSVTIGGQNAPITAPSTFAVRLNNATAAGAFSAGPTGAGTVNNLTAAGALGSQKQDTNVINTSYVGAFSAPATIFQDGFYGANTFTAQGLTASASYTVTLFFCEVIYGPGNPSGGVGTGQRKFNIALNSAPVATNFDIWATASTINGGGTGSNVAITQQYTVSADTNGKIAVGLTNVTDNALLQAIMITPNFVAVTSPSINTGGSYAGATKVDVVVTSPYGTGQSLVSAGAGYSYLPIVTADTPASVPYVPTDPITINGTGFLNATIVQFGSKQITIPANTSDTQIVMVPATEADAGGANVSVSVSTVTPNGTLTSLTTTTLNYVLPPTISTLLPVSGAVTGGNSLTINGTNLTGVTSVSIGGASATLPPSGLSTIAVRFGSNTALAQGSWTFLGQAGYGGNGLNTNNNAVTLTSALTTAYPGITTGLFNAFSQGNNITYTFTGMTPNAAANITLFLAEQYAPYGTGNRVWSVAINGTTPTAFTNIDVAKLGGGSNKAIFLQATGTADGTGTLKLVCTATVDQPCLCGGILIQGNLPTSLSVTTPAVTFGGGQYPVVVTGPGGIATTTPTYSYLPVITGMTPNVGPLTPTVPVTITGNGFTGTTQVNFGSNAATSFVSVSETSITVLPPTGVAGTVTVTVAAQGTGTGVTGPATSTTSSTYTYMPPPLISVITPNGGPVGGGPSVTITGTAISSATSVTFNGIPGTGLTGQSTIALNCGGDGAVGTFTADQYNTGGWNGGGGVGTVTLVPPATSALFPPGNTSAQQNQIVKSTRYDGANTGFYYTIPNLVPGSQCTVTLFFAEDWFGVGANGWGQGTILGGSRVFNVFVNDSATPQLANYDAIKAANAIMGTGQSNANVLTGQQFTATVKSDGTLKISFASVVNQALVNGIVVTGDFTNSTNLVVTPPAITGTGYSGPAKVDVVVTTPYGTATSTLGYSYLPAITSVSPGFGQYTPTNPVTINGSGFTAATGFTTMVTFGSAAPITVTPTSDNTISVTPPTAVAAGVPTGGPVTVSVSVVTVNGTLTSLTDGSFEYMQPSIAAITPNIGPVGGGNSVVITGTNLNNPTSVTFGTQSATITSGATPVVSMGAGSTTAAGSFTAEVAGDVTGGSAVVTPLGTVINTTLVNVLNAPAGLFANGRTNGPITYVIPGLTAGGNYSVALFFCESDYSAAGSRLFNASINSTQVLNNFDIWATANAMSGTTGSNMAIYKQFATTADATGNITIALTNGTAGFALINGLSITPALTVTAPAGTTPGPVDVVVNSPLGTATSPGGYTYGGVLAVSAPTATSGTTYTVGQTISINVTFSTPVTMAGTPPTLTLNTAPIPAVVNFTSLDSTKTIMTFTYTVGAGQTSALLDYPNTTALSVSTGTIQDALGNNIVLTLPANGNAGTDPLYGMGLIVNTVPKVTSVASTMTGAHKAGDVITITVTFDNQVTVTGLPTLALNTTPGATAIYDSMDGTAKILTFKYTVGTTDTSALLDYTGTNALALSGGTIMDSASVNSVNMTLPAIGGVDPNDLLFPQNIIIDTTPPTITIATPPALGTDGTVSYTVNYVDTNFKASTLATTDITLNKTGTANGTVAVTGAGPGNTSCTVTISGITGIGTLGISIGPNTASDTAGNLAPASAASTTVKILPSTATVAALISGGGNTYKTGDTLQVPVQAGQGGTDIVATLTVTANANGTVQSASVATGGSYSYQKLPGPTNDGKTAATTDNPPGTGTGATFDLAFSTPSVTSVTLVAGGGSTVSEEYQQGDLIKVTGSSSSTPGFLQVISVSTNPPVGQVTGLSPYAANSPLTTFDPSNPKGTASAGYYNPVGSNPISSSPTLNVTNAKAVGATVTVTVAPLVYSPTSPLAWSFTLPNANKTVTLNATSFTSNTVTTGTFGLTFSSGVNPSYTVTYYTVGGVNQASKPGPDLSTIPPAGLGDSKYATAGPDFTMTQLTLTLTNPITPGTSGSVPSSGSIDSTSYWPTPSTNMTDYYNAFWSGTDSTNNTFTVTKVDTPYKWTQTDPGKPFIAATPASTSFSFAPANSKTPDNTLGTTSYVGNAGMYLFKDDTSSSGSGAKLTCTISGFAISGATIASAGSGYQANATINLTVSDPLGGNGGVVQVTTDGTGAVNKVVQVIQGGNGYVPPTGSTTLTADTVPQNNNSNSGFSSGPFFADSKTRLNEITDGTSNTLAFGETLGGPEIGPPTYANSWMAIGVLPTYWDCQTPSTWFTFGSNHPGFVNFAFCDGSVRGISKVVSTDKYSSTSNPPAVPPDPPAAYGSAHWRNFQLLGGMNDNQTIDWSTLGGGASGN